MGGWAGRVVALRAEGTAPERIADPPAQVGGAAALVILTATAVFGAAGLAGGGFAGLPPWATAALMVLTAAAVAVRTPEAVHVTTFALCTALAYQMPGAGAHPFPLTTALAAYAFVVITFTSLRQSVEWVHVGSVEPSMRRLGLAIALLSAGGLLVWLWAAQPDLVSQRAVLADVPRWALPPLGVFFALVNAGVEELAFRGVLLDGLRSAVGDVAAVVLQAVAFGLVHHAHGIPFGVSGAMLACLYGLALGVLRLRAGGLVLCWLVHAATDLVIFIVLVSTL